MKNEHFSSFEKTRIENNPKKRALFQIKIIEKTNDKSHLSEIFLFNILLSLLHRQGTQTNTSMNVDLEIKEKKIFRGMK
jgi:hypothetical protein